MPSSRFRAHAAAVLVFGAVVACDNDDPQPGEPVVRTFLEGTAADAGIAYMLSSSNNSLLMLQTGSPTTRREIPFGASTEITPTGASIRKTVAAVPLGNAASVAIVDLTTSAVQKYFRFSGG